MQDVEIMIKKRDHPEDINQVLKTLVADLKIQMNLQTFLPSGVPQKACLGQVGIQGDKILISLKGNYFKLGAQERNEEWFSRLNAVMMKMPETMVDYGFITEIEVVEEDIEGGQEIFLGFEDHTC
jgi:hypothetical protein